MTLVTVITPVFDREGQNILFYVASRGHHADIGGLGGTSMPPNSTEVSFGLHDNSGSGVLIFTSCGKKVP